MSGDLLAIQTGFAGDPAVLAQLAMVLEAPDRAAAVATFAAWCSGRACDLTGVVLRGCDCHDIPLPKAILLGANANRANLAGCDLGGADLRLTDLSECDLRRAVLREADAQGAYLVKSDLRHADLRGLRLGEGTLARCRLDDALVHGADLRWVRGISRNMLAVAQGDAATSIPEGLTRPEQWLA